MLEFSLGTGIRAGVWMGNGASRPSFAFQKMEQVHGTEVVEILGYGPAPKADALWTREKELCLAVYTADCLPLVLADEAAGLIAGIHAGWRGLTADIIPKTLAVLCENGAKAAHLKVGIGPFLGVECCVFSRPFEEIPEKYHWAILEQRVDLKAIALKQLLACGVVPAHVEWSPLCTACTPELPSWRRDRSSERLCTYIERNS